MSKPTPLSRTNIPSRPSSSRDQPTSTTAGSRSRVYLSALSSRLSSTCLSRRGSPSTSGSSPATSSTLRSACLAASSDQASRTSAPMATGCGSIAWRCRREKASRSSTSSPICLAPSWIRWKWRRAGADSSWPCSSSRMRAKPVIARSGAQVVGDRVGEALQLRVGRPQRAVTGLERGGPLGHALLELLVERAQLVVELLDRLLGAAPLADVAGHHDEPPQPAVVVPQGGERGAGPDAAAVLAHADDPDLEVTGCRGALEDQLRLPGGDVLVGEQDAVVAVEDLARRVAGDLLGAQVPARHPATRREHEGRVVPGALDQQPEAFLRGAQRGLRRAAGVLGLLLRAHREADHQHQEQHRRQDRQGVPELLAEQAGALAEAAQPLEDRRAEQRGRQQAAGEDASGSRPGERAGQPYACQPRSFCSTPRSRSTWAPSAPRAPRLSGVAGAQRVSSPASTTRALPVTCLAPSEARKRTASATSCGSIQGTGKRLPAERSAISLHQSCHRPGAPHATGHAAVPTVGLRRRG